MSRPYEVRVRDKRSGRTEPNRHFATLGEAERYASGFIPTRGDRAFRIEMQDMRTGVRDPVMTELPGFRLEIRDGKPDPIRVMVFE